MAVMHVVTFTFAADIVDEVTSALAAALDDLVPRTKAIRYFHGPDIGIRDGNAHYAVTAIFGNQRAFLDYLASPEHQQIIHDRITPHLQSRSAVQFHVPLNRFDTSLDDSAIGSCN
ncbi:Dabb family protein [Mycobacterium colombiense]